MENESESIRLTDTRPRLVGTKWIVVLLVVAAIAAGWTMLSGRGGVSGADLDLLPANSSIVLVADVEQILASSIGETVLDLFSGPYGEFEEEMRSEAGIGPDDIRYLVFGGDLRARQPMIVLVFKEALDEEQIARVARSMRTDDSSPREVEGHKVWGDENDRVSMGWVRSDALIIGMPADVESALRGRGGGELTKVVAAEAGLDASLAFAFDWSAVEPIRRDLARELRDVAPVLLRRFGPIVGRADFGGNITASAKALDAAGEVVASYTFELDGEFLAGILTDLARLVPRREPRRYPAAQPSTEILQPQIPREPEPVVAEPPPARETRPR